MGAAQTASAQNYNYDNLTIAAKVNAGATASTTTYYGKAAATGNTFVALPASLGTFDSNGALRITAFAANVTAPNPSNGSNAISSSSVSYRIYSTGTTAPAFTTVALNAFVANTGQSPSNSGTYSQATTINLLQLAGLAFGSYTLDIQYSTVNKQGGGTNTFYDPSNSTVYSTTFTISPVAVTPAGATTVWIGGTAAGPNNWLLPLNWTNGVPTPQSDAIIPSRPNPQPFEPRLNASAALYAVRNLTLEGAGTSNRAIMRLTTATLLVYGDISNPNNGILATTDAPGSQPGDGSAATIILAGGDQLINQGRFASVIVQNNTVAANGTISASSTPAIKSVTGVLEIPGELLFATGVKAVMRTSKYTTPTSGILTLDTSQQTNVDLKAGGIVTGETNTAFVLGILKTDREVTTGVKESFGNIGIEITINGVTTPGRGFITRTVGDAYAPFQDASGQPIPGTARSVKRIFGNSFASLQTGYNANVRIHYQNSGALNSNANSGPGTYNELNGNPDGMLAVYRTTSNATFQKLPSADVVNTVVNSPYSATEGYVQSNGLNNINTLTLADGSPSAPQLPLPVVLSAFDAKRNGGDALITWATASEKNSRGFDVEVSTDGRYFRSLSFVASTSANSSSAQNYRFIDVEVGKSGKRYYRLRQTDTDGKISLSLVKVIDFGTGASAATSATLLGYPNPFTSELNVSIAGAGNGAATLRLTDLAGRTIRTQQVSLEGASSNLKLDGLGDLKAGTYIMQMTTPSGKTQTFKVQKQ